MFNSLPVGRQAGPKLFLFISLLAQRNEAKKVHFFLGVSENQRFPEPFDWPKLAPRFRKFLTASLTYSHRKRNSRSALLPYYEVLTFE